MRTLQPTSFKHKNNTLKLFCKQPKTIFGDLYNYIRFYLLKRKIPPTQYRRRILSGETDGKMIGCVAGRYVLSGQSSAESGGYHGENHHFSAGFGIKGIMEAWVRQYGFAKFITVKWR